ncbi:MAG: class I SAM-dependent methyltransferase [Gemmatimonadota bacterium]
MTPAASARSRRAAGAGLPHDTRRPDVETAADGYATRFAGEVGSWFLGIQSAAVLSLLREAAGDAPLRVLDVGGGHGQLLEPLRAAGHRVTVHGSDPSCHLRSRLPPELASARVVSDLWRLPFRAAAYELVLGIRLLAHVEAWRELLDEMGRVTSRLLLVDFPPAGGWTRLAPALFGLKHRVEGKTRPFFSYVPAEVADALRESGFQVRSVRREFSLPMALHRRLRSPVVSHSLEAALGRAGVTRRFGAPALLLAERVRAA